MSAEKVQNAFKALVEESIGDAGKKRMWELWGLASWFGIDLQKVVDQVLKERKNKTD